MNTAYDSLHDHGAVLGQRGTGRFGGVITSIYVYPFDCMYLIDPSGQCGGVFRTS